MAKKNANEGYQPQEERGYQPKKFQDGYKPVKSIPITPPNQGSSVQSPKKK